MKRIFLSILFICSAKFVFAQNIFIDSLKINKPQTFSKRNIYRIVLTAPLVHEYASTLIVSGAYERKLTNLITGFARIGIGTHVKNFSSNGSPQYSFHFCAAAELRYFFLQNVRQKKGRVVTNFSGPYLGLEQSLLSYPFALLNQVSANAIEGLSGMYINLGYQKQIEKFYFHGSLGSLIWTDNLSILKNPNYSIGEFQASVSVGYVF
jgi:hypothetical protein